MHARLEIPLDHRTLGFQTFAALEIELLALAAALFAF
jgi:hypothetical protein